MMEILLINCPEIGEKGKYNNQSYIKNADSIQFTEDNITIYYKPDKYRVSVTVKVSNIVSIDTY